MFNLIALQKKTNTQFLIIATIFENNVHCPLAKRDIEKEYGLRYSFQQIQFPQQFQSIEELIDQCLPLPGDLQRGLRNFYTKFHKYGLECQSTKRNNMIYIWNPKLISEFDTSVSQPLRNLFKTKAKIEEFKEHHHHVCELCESDLRLTIDHWRAYSTYQIDDERIAVLLCEKCNNIHHNRDAIHCVKKNADNINYIKKWIQIEKRICDYGFLPNEKDALYQKKIKQQISHRWKTFHKTPIDFWNV